MTNILLTVGIILIGFVALLELLLLRRKVIIDFSPMHQPLENVERSYQRVERAVKEEIACNREESLASARQLREELGNNVKGVVDSLNKQLFAMAQTEDQRLATIRETIDQRLQNIQGEQAKGLGQVRQDSLSTTKALRDEIGISLKEYSQSLVSSVGEMSSLQKANLDVFSDRLDKLTQSNDQKLASMRETIEQRIAFGQDENGKKVDQMRQEANSAAQKAREEVTSALKIFGDNTSNSITEMGGHQHTQLCSMVEQLGRLSEGIEKRLDAQRSAVDERMTQIQVDTANHSKQLREELGSSLKAFNDSVLKGMTSMADSQQKQLESLSSQFNRLTETSQKNLEGLKSSVEQKLESIKEDNAKQLDQMRATVDEKLQGTLERRLGESFTQVSERLEAVYKGLGEMQSLATGVGDLKKVLTNVKTRGTWGEVQLGTLLEQVLTVDQYATNVALKEGGERVEFAIKLPGRSEDRSEIVWLPIDAKFPVEAYQRLMEAQERADPEATEAASRQLEGRVKASAVDICSKYLNPPNTTDFGILFIPIEGLFAEVIRRVGLCEVVQRECRVIIAGPTTLWSILNSLQMGFRTLAIQKRSSEVWNLLAAVKTEWSKYGEILDKVQKKLQEASNTVEDATRRTRVIGRKLKDVQELPVEMAQSFLVLEPAEIEEEALLQSEVSEARDSSFPANSH
jgi:DNA recombination protein RmuC